jgi:hypothetical protein
MKLRLALEHMYDNLLVAFFVWLGREDKLIGIEEVM